MEYNISKIISGSEDSLKRQVSKLYGYYDSVELMKASKCKLYYSFDINKFVFIQLNIIFKQMSLFNKGSIFNQIRHYFTKPNLPSEIAEPEDEK